jgi:hypothetical protein
LRSLRVQFHTAVGQQSNGAIGRDLLRRFAVGSPVRAENLPPVRRFFSAKHQILRSLRRDVVTDRSLKRAHKFSARLEPKNNEIRYNDFVSVRNLVGIL